MFFRRQPVFFRDRDRGARAVSTLAATEFGGEEVRNEEFALAAVNSEMRTVQTGCARHLNNCTRAGFEFDEQRVAVVGRDRRPAPFRNKRGKIAEDAARWSHDEP